MFLALPSKYLFILNIEIEQKLLFHNWESAGWLTAYEMTIGLSSVYVIRHHLMENMSRFYAGLVELFSPSLIVT